MKMGEAGDITSRRVKKGERLYTGRGNYKQAVKAGRSRDWGWGKDGQ